MARLMRPNRTLVSLPSRLAEPQLVLVFRPMINGVHALIYASDADKVRAFFRDVLGFPAVDAGHGWLIFALPPAELGVHPAEGKVYHELYLICDDIQSTVRDLQRKGVACAPVQDVGWGKVTSINVPGGGEMGLYEPRHPTAIGLRPKATKSARRNPSSTHTPKRTIARKAKKVPRRKPRRK